MNNLAISYNATGKKQKALEMREGVYELSKEVLGEKAVVLPAKEYDINLVMPSVGFQNKKMLDL